MKVASYVSILMIVVWTILTVPMIWGTELIPFEMYVKVSISMLLIGGGIIIIALIAREYISENKMKKDKFLG